MALVGLTEDSERITVDLDDDDDDDGDYEKKVMTLAHPELCIGCTSCARICSKKCNDHAQAMV